MSPGKEGVVVRVWELGGGTAVCQYTGHGSAVHQVSTMGHISSSSSNDASTAAGGSGPWSHQQNWQGGVEEQGGPEGLATRVGPGLIASLDVSGGIHIWRSDTGGAVTTFIPDEMPDTTDSLRSGLQPAGVGLTSLAGVTAHATANAAASLAAAGVGTSSTSGSHSSSAASGAASLVTPSGGSVTAAGGNHSGGLAGANPPAGWYSGYRGGFLQRGCSSGPGWQALSGQNMVLQPPSPYAAGIGAGATAALGLGAPFGYTCLASPGGCGFGAGISSSTGGTWDGRLLAGTADARICVLDVNTGGLMREMLAVASGNGMEPSSTVVQAVATGGTGSSSSWIAAGTGQGWMLLLDHRCSTAVASWRGHEGGVLQCEGVGGRHQLLSLGHDRLLKVWDLRRLGSSATVGAKAGGPRAWASGEPLAAYGFLAEEGVHAGGKVAATAAAAPPRMQQAWRAGKEGLEGFTVYKEMAVVYGGHHIGVVPVGGQAGPLTAAAAGRGGSAGKDRGAGKGEAVQLVRTQGIKGERKGKEGAGIVGVGLLPHSRLMVVGTEDGFLKVCC